MVLKSPAKVLCSRTSDNVGKIMSDGTTEKIKIDRSEPLELDSRGRVTIPANIRDKHGIHPDDDRTIWLEVNIEEAEIQYDDTGGDGSE